MNIMMVDVTDLPAVAVGDEVVLIGRQGRSVIPVEDAASDAGTISYEVLSKIAPHNPRILI